MVANYVTHPPRLERFKGTTLAMYIGSSIGNFSPDEARTILRNLRSELRAGDAILRRLNRELCANFDTGCFWRRAHWNRTESRIEMHLESTRHQCVNIPAAKMRIQLAASETIHTDSSYSSATVRSFHCWRIQAFGSSGHGHGSGTP